MKKLEIVTLVLAVVGIILKLLLVSGGSSFFFSFMMLLCFVYFFLGVFLFNGIPVKSMFKKASYLHMSASYIIFSFLAGLALAIACIGIVFKFQSWPGASFELLIGAFCCISVSVVCLVKRASTNNRHYREMLTRAVIFAAICASLAFLPRNILFAMLHRDNPAYIQAMERAWAEPDNQQLWDKAREEMKKSKH